MKLVNLTPHELVIKSPRINKITGRDDGMSTRLKPSGTVARIEMGYKNAGWIARDGGSSSGSDSNSLYGLPDHQIRAVRQAPGEITGLPDPVEDTIFITSTMVAAEVKRPDVVAPDTGETAERNEKGHIVAVTRLVRFDHLPPAPPAAETRWDELDENPDEAF